MASYLISGPSDPLAPKECTSIQQVADALAFAGLQSVTLEELEAAAIHNALRQSRGNRTEAARLLDISVRTLQRKLKTPPMAAAL